MKYSELIELQKRALKGDAAAIGKVFEHIEDLRILIDELSEGQHSKALQSRIALAFGHLDNDEDSE